jgi:hemoglobin
MTDTARDPDAPGKTETGTEDVAAEPSAYDLLGGEAVVRRIVDRFYDLMDSDPDFHGIRKLHPDTLDGSREKLFLFLCGWLGGPQYYVEKYGHPMLRARHLPYAIASNERDQWLICMGRAMVDCGVSEPMIDRLLPAFFNTADWMRNREG